MHKYEVIVPISGKASIVVEAPDYDAAVKKAIEQLGKDADGAEVAWRPVEGCAQHSGLEAYKVDTL